MLGKTGELQDRNKLGKQFEFAEKNAAALNEQRQGNILNFRAMTVMEMVLKGRLLDHVPFGLSPHSSCSQQKDGLI